MAELVLHIGTKKTGTTFLQRYLQVNRPMLKRAGWTYPDFLGDANHMALALPFEERITKDHQTRSMLDGRGRARAAERLGAQLSKRVRPGQRWIITSEQFSSRLQSPAQVQAAAGFLRKYFDEITVVVFFRRQEFVFPSIYSQRVKAGGHQRWSWRFCERRLPELDYDAMYRRWSDCVGAANIVALPYFEADKRNAGQLLAAFGSASGIEFGPDAVMPTESRANRSLSAEGIAFLRAINRYVPPIGPDGTPNHRQRSKVLEGVMELTPGPSFNPGPDVIDRVTAAYERANDRLLTHLPQDGASKALWAQWLGQSPQTAEQVAEVDISADRVVQLMVALAGPGGPVAWGRADGKPLHQRALDRLVDRTNRHYLLRRGRLALGKEGQHHE